MTVDQEKVEITPEKIKKTSRKISNSKAPCPDFIQVFWLKTLRRSLQKCLENGNVPCG